VAGEGEGKALGGDEFNFGLVTSVIFFSPVPRHQTNPTSTVRKIPIPIKADLSDGFIGNSITWLFTQ